MTVTLKMKYYDFQSITRSITAKEPISDNDMIMKYVGSLLDDTEAGMKRVRLFGISISNFIDESGKNRRYFQLPLPFNGWELNEF